MKVAWVTDRPGGHVDRFVASFLAAGWRVEPLFIEDPALPTPPATRIAAFAPDVILAGPIPSAGPAAIAAAGDVPVVLQSWGFDLLLHATRDTAVAERCRDALASARGFFGDCQATVSAASALGMSEAVPRLILPWGTDLAQFRPAPAFPEGPFTIASVRSWEPLYRVPTLILGFGQFARDHAGARLLLAGDGSERPAVEAAIAECPPGSVECAGRVAAPDLARLFQRAHLYANASAVDGTSVSLLEAMACGLPVVSSGPGGTAEWIEPGRNGILVEPATEGAFAEAFARAAADPAWWEAAGRANRRIVEDRADWAANFSRLTSFLAVMAAGDAP